MQFEKSFMVHLGFLLAFPICRSKDSAVESCFSPKVISEKSIEVNSVERKKL